MQVTNLKPDQLVLAAILTASFCLFFLGLIFEAKAQPVEPYVADLQDNKPVVDADFSPKGDDQNQNKGNFGEALTDTLITMRGWQKVPSTYGKSGSGIDGIFLKEQGEITLIRIVETKVDGGNLSSYDLKRKARLFTPASRWMTYG